MEIAKNEYFSLEWYAEKSLLIYTAFPKSEEMTTEDLKIGFIAVCEFMEQNQPKFFLSDSSQQFSVISPELQEWIAANVYPRWYAAGLKKLAIVIPSELLANLSIQQAVEEVEEIKDSGAYEIRYFENPTIAQEWLK